jgi:signal transduction histidine kinase
MHILKLYAGWVTSFKTELFFRGKVKLAAYYKLCILTIFVIGFVVGNFLDQINETTQNVFNNFGFHTEDDFDQLEKLFYYFGGSFALALSVILIYFLAKKTLQPAEDSFIKQKQFTSDTSHELKTPLTVIKMGVSQAFKEKFDETQYKKLLKDVLEEINSLIVITDDLLLLANSEILVSIQPNPHSIDFIKLINQDHRTVQDRVWF